MQKFLGFLNAPRALQIIILVLYWILAGVGTARAQWWYYSGPLSYVEPLPTDGVRLGPLRIHPGVGVSEIFTDNIFLEPEGDSDFVTTVSPFLDLTLPFGRHSFDLEYQSDFYFPARFTEFKVDHHFVGGSFTFDFPGGLNTRVGYDFAASSNPPTFDGDDIKRYQSNSPFLAVNYAFTDRYSITLDYRHDSSRFDESEWDIDDSDVDDVGLDLNYRILPKTTVFLRGGWAYERFPNRETIITNNELVQSNTDNQNYLIWVGARTTPAAKIVGSLAGGYTYRVWDDDTAGDPVGAFTFRGDLYYNLTPRTRLSLALSRSIDTTLASTTSNIVYGTSYTNTTFTLGASQAFTPRLTTSAFLGFNFREYSGEGGGVSAPRGDRDDTQFGANVALEYRIWRYIGLGLSYRYVNNDSNDDIEDFEENSFTLKISFRL